MDVRSLSPKQLKEMRKRLNRGWLFGVLNTESIEGIVKIDIDNELIRRKHEKLKDKR